MKKSLAALLLISSFTSGCATIIKGQSQDLTVNTNPSGASCVITRNGANVATINPTPATIHIEKTKYDILVTCDKKGYETATYSGHSGNEGAVLGNIIAGGGIGWAVDSATGSDNHYESPINIMLPKK